MALIPADMKEFSEEIREASPANFLIKIESFSLLSEYEIDKYESRPFEAGGHKWKLVIYFDGNEECHVSAQFSMAEIERDSLPEGWEFNAICSFFVYNQLLDNYLCFRGMTRRFNAVKSKLGFSKLISKSDLIDPSKGYVVDDSCVFGAEVFVIKPQRVNECLSLIKDASSCKHHWEISDFSELGHVWSSEEFEVGDHKWKVNMYPKGDGSRSKEPHLAIYVQCVDSKAFVPHHKLKAEVTLRIKSFVNEFDFARRFAVCWFTKSAQCLGYSDFIPTADMISDGYLVDDCCYLEIEISVQALALDAPKI